MTGHDSRRVAPFGNPRIAGCFASPWLIADCYVLLRLLVPRHPPYALDNFAEISIDDRYYRRVDILRHQHDSMIRALQGLPLLHAHTEKLFDLTLLLSHVCGRSDDRMHFRTISQSLEMSMN